MRGVSGRVYNIAGIMLAIVKFVCHRAIMTKSFVSG